MTVTLTYDPDDKYAAACAFYSTDMAHALTDIHNSVRNFLKHGATDNKEACRATLEGVKRACAEATAFTEFTA